MEDEEKKLLDLSQQIIKTVSSPDFIMEEDLNEELVTMYDSILFFMNQKDYKKAIEEANNVLKKINEGNNTKSFE
tara:strand:- start:1758 stop:1982 length:225 start_codon:yes stop_codon:yes gene_type:complete